MIVMMYFLLYQYCRLGLFMQQKGKSHQRTHFSRLQCPLRTRLCFTTKPMFSQEFFDGWRLVRTYLVRRYQRIFHYVDQFLHGKSDRWMLESDATFRLFHYAYGWVSGRLGHFVPTACSFVEHQSVRRSFAHTQGSRGRLPCGYGMRRRKCCSFGTRWRTSFCSS